MTRRTPSVRACSSLYHILIVDPGVAQLADGSNFRSTSLSLKTTLVRGLLLANGYPSVQPHGIAGTFAESLALTVAFPDVPEATATFFVVCDIMNVCVKVTQSPGFKGPQLPTFTSSDVFDGVPASSTSVPEAGKNFPVLQMTYV